MIRNTRLYRWALRNPTLAVAALVALLTLGCFGDWIIDWLVEMLP